MNVHPVDRYRKMMTTGLPSIHIRRATVDDIIAMTQLHCACLRPEDHVPMMLGARYVKATYAWHVKSPEAYVLVATIGAKIVGLVGVSDKPFTWPMFKACIGVFVWSLLLNPLLLFRKQLWARMVRRPKRRKLLQERHLLNSPQVAQMTIGAVDPSYRGRGIFGILIEATKEVSRKRGSRAIVAGIYRENDSSRRTFVKCGWVETPCIETDETVFYTAVLDEAQLPELSLLMGNVTH